MPLIPVSDAPSELLTFFHTEKESILARCYEPEPGLFIAESAKVTMRASDAGYEIVAMLIEDAQINQEAETLFSAFPSVPAYHAPSDLFREISGYPMTRGVLSLFRRRKKSSATDILERILDLHSDPLIDQHADPHTDLHSDPNTDPHTDQHSDQHSDPNTDPHTDPLRDHIRIAVLEDVSNPANTGAIFRNAAALGIDAVFLTKGCCDPLSRRCLRVSMGTVFQVPWAMTGQTGSCLIPELKKYGIKSAAMALSDDSVSISDPELKQTLKLAIFLGNEGNGLPKETISGCDYVVRIPMNEHVDSLNVAAASAVSFWELRI